MLIIDPYHSSIPDVMDNQGLEKIDWDCNCCRRAKRIANSIRRSAITICDLSGDRPTTRPLMKGEKCEVVGVNGEAGVGIKAGDLVIIDFVAYSYVSKNGAWHEAGTHGRAAISPILGANSNERGSAAGSEYQVPQS